MIVVTGGAGFIGSNLVKGLNEQNYTDIIVVDDLTDGTKFTNIVDCEIADYFDKDIFIERLECGLLPDNIKAVVHLGACSETTEWNGQLMMENNYEYSKKVFHYCIKNAIPMIYASSAAVYGANTEFCEQRENEQPLNVYGYSKFLFDQYVRRHQDIIKSQVVGLRYFNVYGPKESHKGTMASVAFHLNNQVRESNEVKLFKGSDGYPDGGQLRDFVYVADTVKVKLWLLDNLQVSGIFNVGSGRAQPFLDVAQAVINWHGHGSIKYIPFPEHLKGHYQSYTLADISALRAAGYTEPFRSVEEGVHEYMEFLNTLGNT